MADRKYRCYITGGQDRFLWDAVFQVLQRVLLAVTGGEGESPIWDTFYHHLYHVFMQESEQVRPQC